MAVVNRETRAEYSPARAVEGGVLHVNATDEPRAAAMDSTMTNVLSRKRWSGSLHLESFDVDLLEK